MRCKKKHTKTHRRINFKYVYECICLYKNSIMYVDCRTFVIDGSWLSAVGCWLLVSTVVRSRLLIFGVDSHSLSFVVVVDGGRLVIVTVDCRRNWRIEVCKFHQYSINARPKCTNILYCSLLYSTGIGAMAHTCMYCRAAHIKILNVIFPVFKEVAWFFQEYFSEVQYSTKEATE